MAPIVFFVSSSIHCVPHAMLSIIMLDVCFVVVLLWKHQNTRIIYFLSFIGFHFISYYELNAFEAFTDIRRMNCFLSFFFFFRLFIFRAKMKGFSPWPGRVSISFFLSLITGKFMNIVGNFLAGLLSSTWAW